MPCYQTLLLILQSWGRVHSFNEIENILTSIAIFNWSIYSILKWLSNNAIFISYGKIKMVITIMPCIPEWVAFYFESLWSRTYSLYKAIFLLCALFLLSGLVFSDNTNHTRSRNDVGSLWMTIVKWNDQEQQFSETENTNTCVCHVPRMALLLLQTINIS